MTESPMITEERYAKLLNILHGLRAATVALSGGADSSLLLAASKEALPGRVYAVTVKTPYVHRGDLDRAARTAEYLGVPYIVLEIPEIPEEIFANPKDRCYRCKQVLFRLILNAAEANASAPAVLDGMNADETSEHRPGTRALGELGIRSPLAEAGLTKKDIRQLSRRKGLPAADAPSGSCLLTRFPYDTHINESDLIRVAAAEDFLAAEGFTQVRVRVHGELARIEVPKKNLACFLNGRVDLDEAKRRFHGFGFRYITLDLEGFRSGSMD